MNKLLLAAISIGIIAILRGQYCLNNKINNMPTKAEFDALRETINTHANNIAADIERLAGQIGAGGLTEAEESAVLTEFQAIADRLKSIADTTPEESTPPTEG